MSGILSKIEAVDDVEIDDVEPVGDAVSRVFDAPEKAVAPTVSDRPRPKKPQPRTPETPKPAPPKPQAKAPETPKPEAKAAAPQQPAKPAKPSKPTPPQEKTAAPAPVAAKPEAPAKKEKPKRLPPRLRKKQEEAEPEATPKADAKDEGRSSEKPTEEADNSKRKVAIPEKLLQKREPAESAPKPQAPEARKPNPEAQRAPAPTPPAPKVSAPTPPAPPVAKEAGAPPPTAVAERAAPPPPLPPAPPTGGSGGGGDEGPAGPMAMPDKEPPAHASPALASLKEATDLSNCLLPLLNALNWRGDIRHIAEALPHFTNSLDITSFRNILATMHYRSRAVKLKMTGIDQRLFPCLYLPEDGNAVILLGYEPSGIRVFDGAANEERILPRENVRGTAYFFNPVDADDLQTAQSKLGWFRAVSERFRALVYQTLGITLVLNILALVTPLFVMAVYDKVVATGSLPTLAFFAFGVGVAIACDLILRMIRSKIMAFIGARLDNIVGIAIFHKILFLPPAFTERATIGAQVARIKDFETIRDFFTGPMAMVLFELPFVVIFIATIAALAGPVVFVSVIMMACFLILGLIISPLLRNSVSRAARASSKKQELIVETLSGMRAVKYCGAEAKWMERFREYSASAALNSFYTAQLSALMQTVSHVLMISAGLGTIIFGVFRVMNGDMTVGALVASMILVWRVLAPLQTGFVSLTRLTQVKSSISQINNLMNIKGERDQHSIVNPIKQIEGFVSFARVSIRYSPESDPALVGVSFELEPGEVICIVGGNGSGKSTALKLLAGMYSPQAGSIRIDNMDIRQMDTVELRHAVAYVPQTMQFFYGTIAQNLRLAHPTATDADLYKACEMAGVLEDVMALSQGSGKWKREAFEVRIGDSSSGQMPTNLLQRLNLARGYLKQSPIMLFDEPGNGLDFESDQKFMKNIDQMRGGTTILMVTHRPSHLRLADKILWLEHGNVRAFGPAEEVLKQMPKDFV